MQFTERYKALTLLLCGLFLFAITSIGQKTYFVYLQSENQQPFYVKLNGKNISSSSIGYVILSKLTNGVYPMQIGFPKSDNAIDFDLKVDGQDQGYLVKDFGEKGWGLFNLQTLAVQMNNSQAAEQRAMVAAAARRAAEERRVADSLAEVVARRTAILREADSLRKVMALQEALNNDTTVAMSIADSGLAAKPMAISRPASGAKPDSPETEIEPSAFTPPVSSKTADADSALITKQVIKEDTTGIDPLTVNQTETAALPEVPVVKKDTLATPPREAATPTVEKTVAPTAAVATKTEGELKFLDMDMSEENPVENKPMTGEKTIDTLARRVPVKSVPENGDKKKTNGLTANNSNTKIVTVPVQQERTPTVSTAGAENECSEFATDKDFFSLRKKMVSSSKREEMISIARKIFRDKCFSTEQVRNLCVLFLTDQGRYDFLDEAYNHTSDPANYKALADLLKDEYYLRRFKAMLR